MHIFIKNLKNKKITFILKKLKISKIKKKYIIQLNKKKISWSPKTGVKIHGQQFWTKTRKQQKRVGKIRKRDKEFCEDKRRMIGVENTESSKKKKKKKVNK